MGAGGTRNGAGRPRYSLAAEQAQRIDIRLWHRGGYLREGRSFSWSWNRGGEPAGNIGVTINNGSIRLGYSVSDGNGQRDGSQTITTTSTPCHYGGSRPWFCCPVCRDRAGLLYLRWGRFACRHCQRVTYQSQSGSALDRVCNRYHRLNAKVENGKPKWQRWATFNRLFDRYYNASEQFDGLICGRLQKLGFEP